MDELVTQLGELDRDPDVRCIVLGGSERAFAAGADIGELASASPVELLYARRVERWDAIRGLWTPLVAAVSRAAQVRAQLVASSAGIRVTSKSLPLRTIPSFTFAPISSPTISRCR